MENYGCPYPEGTHVEEAFIIKFCLYFDPAVVSLNKGNVSYKEYISGILLNRKDWASEKNIAEWKSLHEFNSFVFFMVYII